MRTFLLRHWRNTVYSNVWIALGAGCWVYAAGWAIGAQQWVAALLVFFATVFVYNFQRVVKLAHRGARHIPGRNSWLFEHRFWIWIWVVVGALGGCFMALFLPHETWKLLIAPAIVSMLYVTRIFPSKDGFITLREVPGMKILWIAACWALVASFLPQTFKTTFDPRVWWMWAEKCAFILAITIPFDVRDLKYDSTAMRTLPQMLGVRGALRLAIGLLGLSAVLIGVALASGWYTPPFAIASFVALLPTAWWVSQTREDRSELFFTGTLDGTIGLQGGLQCLALWLS